VDSRVPGLAGDQVEPVVHLAHVDRRWKDAVPQGQARGRQIQRGASGKQPSSHRLGRGDRHAARPEKFGEHGDLGIVQVTAAGRVGEDDIDLSGGDTGAAQPFTWITARRSDPDLRVCGR
jgi:hypothetical protein